jgi:hypothetical protein
MIKTALTLAATLLAGCSGKVLYTPPTPLVLSPNSVTLHAARVDVWRSLVPALARSFFVVNNLDQASGFINLSYSGDPERFVDCGVIKSIVENARGKRVYEFPGSRAQQEYEIYEGTNFYIVSRTLLLDGRANIVLEEVGGDSTRVTANVRYVLTKTTYAKESGGRTSAPHVESISFNTNSSASFPGNNATACRPAGEMERTLLELVKP